MPRWPNVEAKNAAGRAGGGYLPEKAQPRCIGQYGPAMAYWPLAVVSGPRPARPLAGKIG